MNLYIHAGLNKTGSSYLQELFLSNKKLLLSNNIYFPEYCFRRNKEGVAAGNASDLLYFVKKLDFYKAKQYLEEKKKQASLNGCDSILLSHESIYHALVDGDGIDFLVRLCEQCSLVLKVLLVFREPEDHAISAFNHRAGVHNLPPFSQWIKNGINYTNLDGLNGYEYFSELERFKKNSWRFKKNKAYCKNIRTM